jgi:hypothetical protein
MPTGLPNVAFKIPDGGKVLIVVNTALTAAASSGECARWDSKLNNLGNIKIKS